jgi:hypothetical protein
MQLDGAGSKVRLWVAANCAQLRPPPVDEAGEARRGRERELAVGNHERLRQELLREEQVGRGLGGEIERRRRLARRTGGREASPFAARRRVRPT